ncbi:hypothetical protein FRC09_010964 [Ceratobasidium sp. 395]|nr:hypothetical protein FRC09_010964 [Ceratobasidium sp. 395]
MSSKRKVSAAGYEDSDDEPEFLPTNPPTIKKSRSATPVMPCISGTPKPGRAPFQLPNSNIPFGRSASQGALRRTTSVSVRSTPSAPETPQMIDGGSSEPELEAPIVPKIERGVENSKIEKPALAVRTDHLNAPTQSVQTRSIRSLERQVNNLTAQLQGQHDVFMTYCKSTDGKLDKLLDVVTPWLLPAGSPTQGPGSTGSVDPTAGLLTAPGAGQTLNGCAVSNPMPTPELSAIVAKGSSLKCSKDLGKWSNHVKEHVRKSFCGMTGGAKALNNLAPHFEDEYGNADVFPSQFIDPVTKYCQPYPHWTIPFQKQALWVPTYVQIYYATIPQVKDPDLVAVLKSLSTEDVVALMYHGPWRTARATWARDHKDKSDIQAMRARQLAWHQSDRKMRSRAEHLKTIPDLQGPTWEFLTQPGYQSEEEEVDGVIMVKRPAYRAPWVNNVLDAADIAEAQKPKVRSSSVPPLPRKISISDVPIPLLTRGSGTSKVTHRVAAVAISKSWRDLHHNDFTKYYAMVDLKAVSKPNVSDFLLRNPRLDSWPDGYSDLGVKAEKVGGGTASEFGGVVGGEASEGEFDGAYGRQALSDDVPIREMEQDDGSQLEEGSTYAGESQAFASADDFPIDPQLLEPTDGELYETQETTTVSTASTTTLTAATTGSHDIKGPGHHSQVVYSLHPPSYPDASAMPPPPVSHSQPSTSGQTTNVAQVPTKRPRGLL